MFIINEKVGTLSFIKTHKRMKTNVTIGVCVFAIETYGVGMLRKPFVGRLIELSSPLEKKRKLAIVIYYCNSHEFCVFFF